MSPEPLPEPPADYGRLAAHFPALAKERLPTSLYRVHQREHEPERFTNFGNSRFDPPDGPAGLFGTCYTATSPLTAFIEVVAELSMVTESTIEDRAMATMQIPRDHRIADLTAPQLIGEWNLDRRISVGDDYGICQRWANALQLAGFNGVFYEPRHHLAATTSDRSLAIFGSPGYQPTQVSVIEDDPIPRHIVEQAQETFAILVLPGATL